jgi:hypothetical protein
VWVIYRGSMAIDATVDPLQWVGDELFVRRIVGRKCNKKLYISDRFSNERKSISQDYFR